MSGAWQSQIALGFLLSQDVITVVSRPGSYTQQLIARVQEAGLQSYEARTVAATDHLPTALSFLLIKLLPDVTHPECEVDALNSLALELAEPSGACFSGTKVSRHIQQKTPGTASGHKANAVGLIISCGSPVELTEPVDLRAHVCKTSGPKPLILNGSMSTL